jgi:ABC-type nitrate/sulfonate/bicarbonate transport system substrate-binding protein
MDVRIGRATVGLGWLLALTLIGAACAPAAAPSQPAPSQPAPAAPPQAGQAAPAPAAPPPPSPTTATPVRVGLLGSASDAGIFIAAEKGFFQDQGLEVEFERFQTGAHMTPALSAGQLDIGAGSPSAGLYNAIGRQITIKIVADKGSNPPGFGFQGIALRKDLADRVRDYRDLRGLRVGMTGSGGTSADIALVQALRRGGLAPEDAEIVVLAYPDLNVALSNGSIDAAIHFEPLFTLGVQQGISVDWKRVDEIYPGHQGAAIFYGAEFTRSQPDAADRWMVAYVQGLRHYNDAFRKNVNRADTIQIIAKHTNIRPELLEQAVPVGLNPDGYINARGLAEDLELLRELGYIKEPVSVEQIVDNRHVDFAIRQLGPYRP